MPLTKSLGHGRLEAAIEATALAARLAPELAQKASTSGGRVDPEKLVALPAGGVCHELRSQGDR